MEEYSEYFPSSSYDDNYKSYEGYLDDYNPDDYEGDFWEDMQPDVERMAEDFERIMEEREYAESGDNYYDRNLSVEELDRRLDDEFYGRRGW